MILEVLLYLGGLVLIFYLLARICDQFFVQSLDIIGRKLKLSEDVAGATFMAIGTSAPEFFTAALALLKVGAEDVGAGTIVGSAIFNILVIVGGSAVVATAYLRWQPVVRDMGFYIIAILVLVFTFRDGEITFWEALLYLGAYAVYIGILARWRHWVPDTKTEKQLGQIEKAMEKEEKQERKSYWWGPLATFIDRVLQFTFPNLDKKPQYYWLTFTIAIIWIIGLSWALVELGVGLAHTLGIPEVIIALTILAAGTSVPDLLSSLIVAKKNRGDMAVSNAVGSNTFDILICLGLPWLIYILITQKNVVVATENLISSVFLLFFTVIAMFFVLAIRKFKIGHRSGYLLLGLYGMYLMYAIGSVYWY